MAATRLSETGTSPFHAGEQAVQSMLGVRAAIEPWARRVVRPCLPQQHRDFYEQLPFVVAAARDREGRPWATLLTGLPGFLQSPDEKHLRIAASLPAGDALTGSLQAGAELGLLGIDLETRRRNRVNGRLAAVDDGALEFEVGQAFGNCPQYITVRAWRHITPPAAVPAAVRGKELDENAIARIAAADTFFIATGYRGDDDNAAYGMDASHRGGAAGFVEVPDTRRLVFPDYAGNNHFNTIGNLIRDPRVGLLFVDFETGGLLQISGTAKVDFGPQDVARYPGAQRLVYVDIERLVMLEQVLPLRWSAAKGSVRSLRLADRVAESDDVTSFVFVAGDGGELPDFEPGQHLPIELRTENGGQAVKRTYSLSNRPGEGLYRISVKRHPRGLASRYLHDRLRVGDIVSSGKPDGAFVLEHSGRPAALISAGVGVTPMASMLHTITRERGNRPVYFLHGVRDGAHHPFAAEMRAVADSHANVTLDVSYSRPREVDVEGIDYTHRGRIDGARIEQLIPGLDADFYLCGPAGFLADVTGALIARGVDRADIHTETFGPAA